MIASLKVFSGFAIKLKIFRNRKILKFKPGLNILFGPNGCGKTTAIKIMSAYSGIVDSGWSGVPRPIFSPKGYPEDFHKNSPGGCQAELGWDGEPVFFFDGVNQGNLPLSFDGFTTPFTSLPEGISEYMSKPSSGMVILKRFSRLWKILESPPDLINKSKECSHYNSVWQENEDRFIKYIKSIREGKNIGIKTILMDEVDRSLSITNQRDLWQKIIPNLSKHFQIIVASHNVFSLKVEGANYIDFEKGYLKECLEATKTI